jgi:hypothetical protein
MVMIENSLERIAVALEQIAKTMRGPEAGIKIDGETAPYNRVPVAAIIVEGEAAKQAVVLGREEIKKKLNALKIQYKVAARTETLAKLLEDAIMEGVAEDLTEARATTLQKVHEKVFNNVEIPAAPVPSAMPSVVTKDMIRTALIELSEKKGKELPLRLIKDVGMAKNLTDTDGRYYVPLYNAVKEAMNG